jgi:hypothetical protein
MNLQKNHENTKEHNSKIEVCTLSQDANINFQILAAPCTAVKCQK